MTMREIQDLTLQSSNRRSLVDQLMRERSILAKSKFDQSNARWLAEAVGNLSGFQVRASFFPLDKIDLGRVHRNQNGIPKFSKFHFEDSAGNKQDMGLIREPDAWKPVLRGTEGRYSQGGIEVWAEFHDNAFIEIGKAIAFRKADGKHIYRDWLLSVLCCGLNNVDRVRRSYGLASLEFAAIVEVLIGANDVKLLGESKNYGWTDSNGSFPIGTCQLPLYSVGPKDEFHELVKLVQQDLWDFVGAERRPIIDIEF